MNHATVVLDVGQFKQALAVLDRERPSPRQLWRFLWLNRSVWTTILLTGSWFLVLIGPLYDLQGLVLRAALACYVLVALLFVANLALVRKIWRAARTERRLGMSKDLDVLTAGMGLRRGRAVERTLGLLIPIGAVCVWVGIAGLLIELPKLASSSEGQVSLYLPALALLLFGLACLSLYPMERGKRRLQAVAILRTRLLGSQRAEDGAVDLRAVTYDRVTDIERTQIIADREESVAARHAGRGSALAVSLSRPFHESLSRLTPEDVSRVHRSLRTLLDGSLMKDGAQASTNQVESLAVPDTSLAIEFVRSLAAGEIRVLSLRGSAATAGFETNGPNQGEVPR